jgi:hypothetical protein
MHMGLFSKKELSEEQVVKVNALLPEKHRKSQWFERDFHGEIDNIYKKTEDYIYRNFRVPEKKKNKALLDFKKTKEDTFAAKIKIFNTELYKAEPLGMVDIGGIHQFSASSTGDRFSGGLIGYAIESAADDMWSKGSSQEEAVNSVKLALLKKARSLYPECNLIFKYEIDFREMGSSGNVFIYMRGTACKGENELLVNAEKQYEEALENKKKELTSIEAKLTEWKEVLIKISQSRKVLSKSGD